MAQTSSSGKAITWDHVKAWVPIIFSIALLLLSAGAFRQTVADMDARLCKIEVKQEKYDDTLIKMQIQLAEIQRDVAYLRAQWEKQGQ
jgi:hypothetical protein